MITIKNKSNGELISKFIGEFKDDKKNGVGLEKFKETQIEGSFIDDKLNGRACLYSKLSKIYLEYKDGLKNGREIELKNDGMIMNGNIISLEIAFLVTITNFFLLAK